MGDYLIFSIAAPMASFGSLAVGERRASATRPTKSQVLGLIAAALGLERNEEERLGRLRDVVGFAVRVEDVGQPAFDFHTAQTPPARRNRRFPTRADELSVPKHELKTILSIREFRTNTLFSPALWLRNLGSEFSLQALRDALVEPRFVLCAGRKAHPLMLPSAPMIVAAETLGDAFAAYDGKLAERITPLKARLGLLARRETVATIYSDLDGVGQHDRRRRIEERRDLPQSRAKWRFGLRQEVVVNGAKEGDEA
jgi:CRISPR system Cascade subunit CasD